ncbi:MAG: GNAT family N-acetyltransferase [Candidatus Bathyarchaeota archaeon]|nr:MAG: GNAT family N-acetyltransferase [Candidatus Bathyarchaeota archaeon]
MLEGKTINLRVAEEDDVSLIVGWWGNTQYMGEYQDVMTKTLPEFKKIVLENTIFLIIEKNEVKIGHIVGWMIGRTMEIGFALIPSERGKGYGTEAIQLMVDHLFLTKDIARIQVTTDVRNKASQRALENVGFAKEGTMRKYFYAKGNYRDHFLYSILRDEWKELKTLKEESKV